jgi:hypothetical protein
LFDFRVGQTLILCPYLSIWIAGRVLDCPSQFFESVSDENVGLNFTLGRP